jgi:opacity protein-like surface antigen
VEVAMPKKIIIWLFSVCSCFFYFSCYADTSLNDKFHNRFYAGLTGGYGSTTWNGLVPNEPDSTMSVSTPVSVSEGGFAWGLFGGYEFIPQFALEASYMHYQAARLYFDYVSLFSFNYNMTELTTRTEDVALMAKIMLIIPTTTIRVFSSVGVAMVHRYDDIKNIWRARPTFGAGFNYNFTDHWMGEVGINYVAGYGQAEMNPAQDYIPFLYSAFLRVGYRF